MVENITRRKDRSDQCIANHAQCPHIMDPFLSLLSFFLRICIAQSDGSRLILEQDHLLVRHLVGDGRKLRVPSKCEIDSGEIDFGFSSHLATPNSPSIHCVQPTVESEHLHHGTNVRIVGHVVFDQEVEILHGECRDNQWNASVMRSIEKSRQRREARSQFAARQQQAQRLAAPSAGRNSARAAEGNDEGEAATNEVDEPARFGDDQAEDLGSDLLDVFEAGIFSGVRSAEGGSLVLVIHFPQICLVIHSGSPGTSYRPRCHFLGKTRTAP